jgi:hypothetical protein
VGLKILNVETVTNDGANGPRGIPANGPAMQISRILSEVLSKAAGGPEFVRERTDVVARCHVVEDQVVVGRRGSGDRRADAAGGTGHDHHGTLDHRAPPGSSEAQRRSRIVGHTAGMTE